jgi:predicted enzyme related to lactoylglutathione lyase
MAEATLGTVSPDGPVGHVPLNMPASYPYPRWPSAIPIWRLAMGRKAKMELVIDCAEPTRLAAFWREALDYRDYYTDANLAVLVPNEGTASPLLLQGVPEPRAGKNRMHLDIIVDDIEAEVRRLQELGAHRIDKSVQSLEGTQWVRMSDPEQNEFCISTGVEW